MVKYLKTFLIILVVVFNLIILGSKLRADTEGEIYPFVYLFHLYYDNGQLFADRDFEFKYDLIAEPFEQSGAITATSYKGEVISVSNNLLSSFQFDPTVTKGKISVKGPYFANAAKVNFYNDKNELLLTLLVSESSVCNEDKICNSDIGEDYNNCPSDCEPPPPVVEKGGFWSLSKIIFAALGAAIIAVVIWIIWLIIKKRRVGSDMMPPPTLPPSIQ
ncbi:MAG: hypothetical protein AAB784_00750 [Patescibacteria group bacterium]